MGSTGHGSLGKLSMVIIASLVWMAQSVQVWGCHPAVPHCSQNGVQYVFRDDYRNEKGVSWKTQHMLQQLSVTCCSNPYIEASHTKWPINMVKWRNLHPWAHGYKWIDDYWTPIYQSAMTAGFVSLNSSKLCPHAIPEVSPSNVPCQKRFQELFPHGVVPPSMPGTLPETTLSQILGISKMGISCLAWNKVKLR